MQVCHLALLAQCSVPLHITVIHVCSSGTYEYIGVHTSASDMHSFVGFPLDPNSVEVSSCMPDCRLCCGNRCVSWPFGEHIVELAGRLTEHFESKLKTLQEQAKSQHNQVEALGKRCVGI